MSSLESLPQDQRAVLDLVLKRGRSYDEIAQMLGIDRAGVRDRALAAFDALGPQTRIAPERRALITDYLLGQLPPRVAEGTRERLAQSASERAWARVLASELAPIAGRLPAEIPLEGAIDGAREAARSASDASGAVPEPPREARQDSDGAPAPEAANGAAEPVRRHVGAPASAAVAAPKQPNRNGPGARAGADTGPARPRERPRPSSRAGGAILLGVGAVVVVAIVAVILIATGGNSKSPSRSASTSTAGSNTRASASTGTSTSKANAAHLVAQINLLPPTSGSKAAGVALVVKQGSNTGIAIKAQNIPANGKHDAYAVWLYNTPADSHILGFVNPPVGSSGTLQTEGVLPANARHFKQILLTDETTSNPRAPGRLILAGTLTGL